MTGREMTAIANRAELQVLSNLYHCVSPPTELSRVA